MMGRRGRPAGRSTLTNERPSPNPPEMATKDRVWFAFECQHLHCTALRASFLEQPNKTRCLLA
jgi:hypothetical protein